ncbi:MAG TPA: hypothetical protein VG147_15095 [Solirubrobacteraceae bacterium]|nr:hypothetical protein [Solirubrobacteraceae bacterium]
MSIAVVTLCMCGATSAAAAPVTPSAGWTIHSAAEPTSFSAADVQNTVDQLTVTATDGTYKLRPAPLSQEPTTAIQWDASAAEIQKALEALPPVGAGNVAVTGGPGDASGSKSYTITWVGALSGTSPGVLEVEASALKDGAAGGSAEISTVSFAETHDRFGVSVVNVGSRPSQGTITVSDNLPTGLRPVKIAVKEPVSLRSGTCSLDELKCTYSEPVLPGRELVVEISVAVTSPELTGSLVNTATVSGGGGEASTSASNPVNAGPTPFGVVGFSFGADGLAGMPDAQAGDHPYGVTTTIDFSTTRETLGEPDVVRDVKDVSVELPLGFAGDPLATERCPEIDLTDSEGYIDTSGFHTACPAGSQVGTISFVWAVGYHTVPYPVYNVVPDRGYPAELGVNAGLGQPLFLYANVVRSPSGYRLRIDTPGALRVTGLEPEEVRMTVFGDPGTANGTGSNAAYVTNPTNCSAVPQSVSTYVTAWEGSSATAEATAYPEVTGCNLLQGTAAFDPSVAIEPETTQADTPSGYTVDLKLPQAPSAFGALATPDLKNATITLPAGVSVSPAAASGPAALAGCPATGPEGINIGSSEVAADGQDLGDPEATELGEGHPGGDNSSYDDGIYHTAPGHCPENSRLGEVEVRTPDLPEPLKGHVYLAEPGCGQAGQSPCTEAEAEEGKVFGVYLEVAGSGVIVKLPGTVEVGGNGTYSVATGLAPGQLRVHFDENPQFPFEEVKVTFPGGQRAALANPQTCGTAMTTSLLEPWSAPESGPSATPSSSFEVTGCSGAMPFKPGFAAGTVTPIAGGYSPFVLQLSRQDGEQDLTGLEATLPEGLLAKLAGVAECGEAEANAGTCTSASQIGTVTVTLGAGSEPLLETGRIYLTGPYNGGPFGEVAVVPAVAGPFNFGNVIVRGSILIDPNTARASIVSNPFPTIVDGIPVRLRTVGVEVNRPGFTFNPTDCDSQAVTATVTAAQGASAAVSSPFAVTGCADLPFKPSFKASTQAGTSRIDGASLVVKVAQKPGEANIHRVHLAFPKVLPARLSTLRGACTEAQFAVNPSGCPVGSVIGTGTAVTPVLSAPLSGPAYLVSHGGAAYPDVVFVLQGDGVTIDLTGGTDIKQGVAYSTFETVPDAPVSSFEAVLPEGPHAIFGANLPGKAKGSFCGRTPAIATTIEGQNGGVLTQSTKIKVTGCPKKVKHKAKRQGGKRKKK